MNHKSSEHSPKNEWQDRECIPESVRRSVSLFLYVNAPKLIGPRQGSGLEICYRKMPLTKF